MSVDPASFPGRRSDISDPALRRKLTNSPIQSRSDVASETKIHKKHTAIK
jgi:hypothetical protein